MSEKHRGNGLAGSEHWLLAPTDLDRRLVDTLRSISADASALYLEGQRLSAALRKELAPLADWHSTVVPAGTGWPEDWYFSYRLRRPLEALDIIARHADAVPPSLVDRIWLFADRHSIWEWRRDGRELLLAPHLATLRIKRVALILERTPTHRDPAA